MYEIKQIFQGGSLYPNGIDWSETPDGIKLEHWMVVSILTPCIVALYLILIMVAYHTFCKVTDCSQDNPTPNGQIEVQLIFKIIQGVPASIGQGYNINFPFFY